MIFSCIIFLGVVSPLIALECLEPEGPCKCRTDQGLVDLSPLDSTNGEPRFKLEVNHEGNVYSYNPCTPFSLPGCPRALICKTNSDHNTGYRRSKASYSGPLLDKERWINVASTFFKPDEPEPVSYALGRTRGYQWSGEDIWDIPPDSREQLDSVDSEGLFINLRGNSPQSDLVRTSSVELVCNHHIDSAFQLIHSEKSHTMEKYLFKLTTRYACPVNNATETPHPDHHPTHGTSSTVSPTGGPHPHPHPTDDPNPEPHPHPTDDPIPDDQLDDCMCIDDSEVVVSKKTLAVAGISFFVILLLVMVISMYCTLLCCVTKKPKPSKQKNMKVYAITTGDSDKNELLA